MSLLERRGVPGAGDEPPTAHEVVSATFREVQAVLTSDDVLVFRVLVSKENGDVCCQCCKSSTFVPCRLH